MYSGPEPLTATDPTGHFSFVPPPKFNISKHAPVCTRHWPPHPPFGGNRETDKSSDRRRKLGRNAERTRARHP